ncbi:MAG: putative MATE family efflux protein [Cyclobacteriaceae bacterium]
MTKKKDLTNGSISSKLVQLTLPMMIGIISMVAFNLVDTYFVGQLGTKQLAALSFTFPVITIIFSIVQGLGIGATALVARSIGVSNRDKAARETTDSLFLAVIIGGFFVIVGILTVEPTFRLLGASEDIIPYVSEYMTIWYYAILFVVVPYVGNSAIRASGDAMTPTLIMLFAVVINAILDPILIFGYGPVPALGLKGAAIATAISRGFTLVLSLYVLYFRERLITLAIPTKEVIMGCWKSILFIGLPSGFSRMIVPLTMAIITAILANYGEAAVAAFGIGSRIDFLAMSVLFALSASIGPFTGQNFGAKKWSRIQQGIEMSARFSLIWGAGTCVALYFMGEHIARVFTDDREIISNVSLYLQIIPLSFGLQGIAQIVNSNLNTLSRPLEASALIVIQMLIVSIPAVYFGASYFDVKGIYYGLTLAYITGGILSYFYNKKIVAALATTS